jgi:HK97 family phage prohead protease
MTAETTVAVAVDTLEVRTTDGGGHVLEGICIPYDQPTLKAGPRPEVFRRGAFASIAEAVGKVRLTDENHASGRRPVGLGEAFEERAGGLWGRFRFYNTRQGRDAFENVTEGTYGGLSIGFRAVREAIVEGVRNVYEARLHHVSLVDDPAYDGAAILQVRSAVEFAALRVRHEMPLDIPDDLDLTRRMARLRR